MKKVMFLVGALMTFSLTMVTPSFAEGEADQWAGHIFAGYNATNGNTKKGAGNLEAQAAKKIDTADLLLKSNISYSESSGRMDGQKWDALAKYALNFGQDDNIYNFYQVYVDHDYFGDIDYRITPSVGIGYHIAKTEDWKWDVDTGIGYRIAKYRSTGLSDDLPTALIHTFMSKRVFDNSYLSEDLTVYPGLSSNSSVLVRSETAFTCPVSEKLDFQLKYILDNNSKPQANKKKTDTQFIAGLRYKF